MFVVLLALWLIFGGVSVKNLALGAVVSALITLLASRFGGRRTPAGLKKAARAARYGLLLLREIVAANLRVIRLVYGGREPEPVLVRFRAELETDAARVLLANSITLTPGTITVELEGDELCVHALDRSMAEGIESCAFIEKAKELEA